MTQEKNLELTAEGQRKLAEELEHLRSVRRKEIYQRLQAARDATDAWDNPELQEAKNEQAFVEGRILALEQLLSEATVAREETPAQRGTVHFGARVTVVDEEGEQDVFTIVGSAEASPASGKISNESPVGRALLGHHAGDVVQVETPAGVRRFTILSVE